MRFSLAADVVHRDDVRIGEGRCRARLPLETRETVGIPRESLGQDFDRDFAAESGVASL